MNTGIQDAHNLAWKLAWVLGKPHKQHPQGQAWLPVHEQEQPRHSHPGLRPPQDVLPCSTEAGAMDEGTLGSPQHSAPRTTAAGGEALVAPARLLSSYQVGGGCLDRIMWVRHLGSYHAGGGSLIPIMCEEAAWIVSCGMRHLDSYHVG